MKYLTANIKYQIHTALDNTYNDGAGALVNTSPMIQAIGNYKTSSSLSPCVRNPGGQGSYAAEVIAKAQAAMPAVVTGTQNVIIFLSDGGFNADSDNFATGFSAKATNQCKQAVEAGASCDGGGHQGLLGGLWRFDGDQRLQQLQHGKRLLAEIHRLHDHAGDRL